MQGITSSKPIASVVSARYRDLQHLIEQIPEQFSSMGTVMDNRRNEIRLIEAGGRKLVVKHYRRIYLPNVIRYSLTSSKAQKAFENAEYLLSKGFETPDPIAYIDVRRLGLITRSYFVSAYSDYRMMHDIITRPVEEVKDLLKAFARFTYSLHEAGIQHMDYSVGNVLFAIRKNEYVFSLIDNNRMKIGPLSKARRIRNFRQLGLNPEMLTVIGLEYARLSGMDDLYVLQKLFFFKWNFQQRRSNKRKFKSLRKQLLSFRTKSLSPCQQ